MKEKTTVKAGVEWFQQQGWTPFAFQKEAWESYLSGCNGLVNAPTGSGKTYSLAIPILLEGRKHSSRQPGLQALWITPVRALTREIQSAISRAAADLAPGWRIEVRSGDTPTSQRQQQWKNPPQVLITTPESLHILLATPGYSQYFRDLKTVVVDEWHELVGSKRGVQAELGLSRLKGLIPRLKIWGISATIGNMDEALEVLMGDRSHDGNVRVIRAEIPKTIEVETILPDVIDTFPWAGHLGIKLLEKVVPIIYNSTSTLIFTNTRSQCEIWYQRLLEVAPDLAGAIAMHHGSISRELRDWVENALHEGLLKAVVCTSSLDLGVDFRPVETVVQVGSPKGVARFMQRAGRSGHQPGARSRIYFAPTHSLEILEGASLRQAIEEGAMESRIPYLRSFDVLVQYLLTLAVSEGFRPEIIRKEIQTTCSFRSISREEWEWALDFISVGGSSLNAYEEYHKIVVEDGIWRVVNKRMAQQHRMNIGAIVSDSSLQVRFLTGGMIGTVEEWFAGQLKPGDVFWFAGRALEFVRIKDMTLQVRKSKSSQGRVPSWMGGRLPFSSQLAVYLRKKIAELGRGLSPDAELQKLRPLAETQQSRSKIPREDELLIEYFADKEGHHLLVYPFEGRFVNEGLAALVAWRISRIRPITFSIAMNDYGFELLSESDIPIDEAIAADVFSTRNLLQDIQSSINSTELAKRRFRDIAGIAGLVFKGYPGNRKKEKHLQSSAQLFFEVFSQYEPDNLLLLEAHEEVMTFQLEEARLREALDRINTQQIILTRPGKPTPFSFPILVDRLREKLSSEKLEDRIRRMTL